MTHSCFYIRRYLYVFVFHVYLETEKFYKDEDYLFYIIEVKFKFK